MTRILLIVMAIASCLSACGDDDGAMTPPPTGGGCIGDGSGRMQMMLSGDYTTSLDWDNAGTGCGGTMTATGFDLTWGREEAEGNYAVIVSIRGLMPGQTGAATGDMTISGSAFMASIFSHENDGVCSFDVTENSVLQESAIGTSYKLVATGSCSESLDGSPRGGTLTVAEGFSFTGLYSAIDAS